MRGKQLQRELKSFGLRQNDVARCVGVSGPTLSLILTGKVLAKEETEKRLTRLLKLCGEVETVIKKRLGGKNELHNKG